MRSRLAFAVLFVSCQEASQVPQDAVADTLPSDGSLAPACETPTPGTNIRFELVARTPGPAVLVTSPPGDARKFVVEQTGRIDILTDDGLLPLPFLDLSDQIASFGEQGLLGMAFHPSYAANGTFFVYYSTGDAQVLARYQRRASDPNRADTAGVVLIAMPDLATNHNGGMIEFGSDGYLYIGTGDGGWDPQMGQNKTGLLGKLLRIDVDSRQNGKEYGVPAENPFADGVGGAPELLHMGLRNPWRWSFDRMTNEMWIGDVGQAAVEEINVIASGSAGPSNFGWHYFEGSTCFSPPCIGLQMTMPDIELQHSDGWCAVIGGQVYRGQCFPDLYGTYLFTDYCKAQLFGARRNMGGTLDVAPVTATYIDDEGTADGMPPAPSSLHEDARGELYLTTTKYRGSSVEGAVYRVFAR